MGAHIADGALELTGSEHREELADLRERVALLRFILERRHRTLTPLVNVWPRLREHIRGHVHASAPGELPKPRLLRCGDANLDLLGLTGHHGMVTGVRRDCQYRCNDIYGQGGPRHASSKLYALDQPSCASSGRRAAYPGTITHIPDSREK